MFTRILVPLDGSERAQRVLPVAGRLARATGGTLILTQVLSAPAELLPFVVPGFEPSTLTADLEGASGYLTGLAALPELADVPVEVEAHSGLVASTILGLVESRHADLIALTSRGRTGLSRWALGSVAQKLARHSPVPVLLLHDDGPVPMGPHPEPDRPLRALIALDGSPAAEAALLPAAVLVAALAAPDPGALHLVHIFEPRTVGGMEAARQYLRAVADRLRQGDLADSRLQLTWSLAQDEDVAEGLAQAAEQGGSAAGAGAPGGCDLIALTSHGRGGRQPWSLGSVAERVLHDSKLPLLVVRPAEGAEGAEPSGA